jgi:hypothetical protein
MIFLRTVAFLNAMHVRKQGKYFANSSDNCASRSHAGRRRGQSFAARQSLAPRSHVHSEAKRMTGGDVGNADQTHHQTEFLRIQLIQPKRRIFHQRIVDEPGGLPHISGRLT